MFVVKRKVHACLWLCFCLGVKSALAQAQNSSQASSDHVVWEPSSGSTNKREISNANGLDYAALNIAKSYDPPPEFYRGPGSSGKRQHGSGVSSAGSGPQLGSVGEHLSEAYNKWRQNANLQDRISVGHYGAGAGAAHGAAHGDGSAHYAYEGHPYEYAGGGGHGGYYSGNSGEQGIPFDVYGSRPLHAPHHVHYGATGGEYAYIDAHEVASHKGPSELSHKALLAKSFLIPLASAAVLGIAAALVSNPLLLQLGTVSGGLTPVIGKRKRRSLRQPYRAHK
ncbi:LOW QUALITY PROTEIN: uncharacterized protein LOC108595580 [Drosophila busckii]|uniref:LOW QUALITY PROTEIN: uncharacterized protein LOC108595580 n=1 Tax=Drosophila busckii TaxID=30019 RepID=UPI0014328A16|nr:LOW QUALITY PROTEIN: uncharacterized protein LOC108595580 [Drosophila busckii]